MGHLVQVSRMYWLDSRILMGLACTKDCSACDDGLSGTGVCLGMANTSLTGKSAS